MCYEDIKRKGKNFDDIQFLLFSATIPDWVNRMARNFMKKDHVFIDMVKFKDNRTSKTVKHYAVYSSTFETKIHSINDFITIYGGKNPKVIIFTERKDEANDVKLRARLQISSDVLHGDIP